jgi:hypothetical protein
MLPQHKQKDSHTITNLVLPNFFKQKFRLSQYALLFFLILPFTNNLIGQVHNNGELFIGDEGLFHIASGNFDFGLGRASTSRTDVNHGAISFSEVANWNGANTSYYLDGFAESSTDFLFPIGHANIYAPIRVTPSNNDIVAAAYFRENPFTIGSTINDNITTLSALEYWSIESSNNDVDISLSWSISSAIPNLTSGSLSNLTIVGWNGSSWIGIPSTIDSNSILGKSSTLDSGSISTSSGISMANYTAFSLGAKKQTIDPDTPDKLIIYIVQNNLHIESSLPIAYLTVYDILGQKVFTEKINGDYNYIRPFYYAEAVYIALVGFDTGKNRLVSTKIMNKN